MLQNEVNTLGAAARTFGSCLRDIERSISLDDLNHGSCLDVPLEELRGRSVLVATTDQLTAGLALIELDGIARRLVLGPPDLGPPHIPHVIATGAVEAVVTNHPDAEMRFPGVERIVSCDPDIRPADPDRTASHRTEWILLTSGTTGRPKLVAHTLAGLAGAIKGGRASESDTVWSTYYDIRRYGGLQIFLRAVLGGTALVLSSTGEPVGNFLPRAATMGVTHMTGTPSHWRRALMSPHANAISPRYVRMSGEIADQAILDSLRATYPNAKIAHAFASTEAGVAFDVDDGLAGFPATLIDQVGAEVEMKIADGSLRIRSGRTALCYLGNEEEALRDQDGFVDTGDMIERRGDRCYFAGRRTGTINVGGLKVHPEEVEAVINRHPKVQMSLVKGRKNPITGAIVIAEVVAVPEVAGESSGTDPEGLKAEIFALCKAALPAHKVPVAIRFVPALNVGESGKLARLNA